MAEEKKSFILYADLINSIDHLTNEEKGILFTHLLEYVNDKNPVLEDRVILSAWKPIQLQLKRDLVKFEEVKAKRSEAGKRSADLRALKKTKQSSTNSTIVENVQHRSTNSTVNDTVNVNENVNDNDISFKKETKDLKDENQDLGKIPESQTSKKVAQKKVSIDDLEMPPEFVPIWEEWRQYRKDRKFKNYAAPKYEQIAVNKFLEMADNDPETGRQIIQQTFAHNYQGLFPLKNTNNGTNQFTNNRTAGNTAGSGTSGSAHVSGKTSFNQILARKLKASGNSESGNITIDAEVVE